MPIPVRSASSVLPPPRIRTRDEALDTIRGALLMAMGVNHVPSALRWLSDQPLGYVSSAEGFVFLAGLVAGRTYTKCGDRLPSRALLLRAAQRALTLYRAHMSTLLLVFACAWASQLLRGQPPPFAPALFLTRPLASLVSSTLLLYQPGLLDILPLYCGMMLLLPFTLRQLDRYGAGWVLALSSVWWLLTNLFDPHPYEGELVLTGAFNFGAWQLLFVLGAVLGHAGVRSRRAPSTPSPGMLSLALLLCCYFFALRHDLVTLPLAAERHLHLINKTCLAPLRLLNVLLWLYVLRNAVARSRALLCCAPLSLVGRQSLPAFCVHVVVASAVLGAPELFAETPVGRWLGPLLIVGSMLAAAWYAERRQTAQRPELHARGKPIEELSVQAG